MKKEIADELFDLPLTKTKLNKIPLKYWKRLFKENYNIELHDISSFDINNNADNGFLTIDCYCDRLNQTSADISEEHFLLMKDYSKQQQFKELNQNDFLLYLNDGGVIMNENKANKISVNHVVFFTTCKNKNYEYKIYLFK